MSSERKKWIKAAPPSPPTLAQPTTHECKQDNNFFASVIKVRFHLMKQSRLTKVRSTQVSKWHLWSNSTSSKSWPPNENLYVFKQNFIFHNPHSLCFSLLGYFRLWALWTRGAQKELLHTRSSSFLTFCPGNWLRVYNLIYPTVVHISWIYAIDTQDKTKLMMLADCDKFLGFIEHSSCWKHY